MSTRPQRPANALKHGAYSQTVVFPGEDPAEFRELHDELVREWDPSGPQENDAVFTIAKALFRKHRLDIFRRAAAARAKYGSIYEKDSKIEQESALVDIAIKGLRRTRDLSEFLLDDKVRQSYRDLADLNRTMVDILKQLEHQNVLQELTLNKDFELAELKELATPEGYERLLDLEDRLDAMIDRATKRLVQLKAVKEVLGFKPSACLPMPNKKQERVDYEDIELKPKVVSMRETKR